MTSYRVREALLRDGGLRREFPGERVIGRHTEKSSEIYASALAHPALAIIAESLDHRVSLVGGAVRDLMRGQGLSSDIDLVVEGDGLAAARAAARALGTEVVVHERFGTATVRLPGGAHLDFVTARRERYPEPGALPEVEPGTLDDDLRRRDFTVNAMALRLNGPDTGRVVDPLDGRADLAAGRLRMHHPDAFRDDPSRIVRAARYAARLGLTLDDATRAAAEVHAPRIDWGSARNAEELRRLFEEDDPESARHLLRAVGAPGLRPGTAVPSAGAVSDVLVEFGPVEVGRGPLLLGIGCDETLIEAVALPGRVVRQAREAARGDAVRAALAELDARSRADALLIAMPIASIVVAAALDARWVRSWWHEDRRRRLAITGDDLLEAGVRAGPRVGEALAAARARMLDGEAESRAEQLRVALAVAR